MQAILLIDHGSRRAEANAMIHCVARMVAFQAQQLGQPKHVIGAHMELAEPTIAQGLASCVTAGAQEVIVHPYLLAPGRHASEDIPRMVAEAAKAYPEIRVCVSAPLGVHAAIAQVVLDRCEQALHGDSNNVGCAADSVQCSQPWCLYSSGNK